MIFAQIKKVSTWDGSELAAYIPEDPVAFCVWVRLIVGPKDADGEESFDVAVCSPEWLKGKCEKDGFILGRHFLIVQDFDWPKIDRNLTKLVERYSGENWAEVANKVGRIGYWEYEDHCA